MSKFRIAMFRPAALAVGALALIFSGTAGAQIAQMTSPVPGTTLTGSSVTFNWTNPLPANVLQVYLYVGSVFGGNDLYGASQGTNTSGTVNNLPTDGRILFVRLWSFVTGAATDINNGWKFNDYQYLAFNSNITCGPLSKAAINSPTPGTTLGGTTVTFAWGGNSCITGYKLLVGTTGVGSSNISSTATTSQSQQVTGLPSDGTTTVNVRLTSTIGGTDYSNDYTYTAFNANTGCATATPAAITSPTAGSTLGGSSQLFQWGPGCGASDYYLYVGSSIGANDIYGQDVMGVTTATGGSITVSGLPTDGRSLFVRLWTLLNGVWRFNDYTYTAAGSAGGCGVPTPATMLTPTTGSTLTAASVTFTWMSNSGSCTTPFTLAVGNEKGGSELFLSSGLGMATSVMVNNLPTDGRALFVRLSTQINGVNQFNDYTYTAFTASANCNTPTPAQMITPAPGSTFTSSTVTFTWGTGCNVTEYFLWIGTASATSNLYSQDQGTKLTATVSGLPTNGSQVFVRLWSMINGIWNFIDYTYTATGTGGGGCGTATAANITSPAPNTMLPGTSVTFVWTAGSCVLNFTLSVGRSTGGTDFYGPTVLSNTTQSAAVGGLPSDGTTAVFVRLITAFTNGTSQTNDYSYTAFNNATGCGTAALATISSPAPNSTIGASTTFTWTAGCQIIQYWLYVGTQVGGSDLYNQNQGASMSVTVTGLPTNGAPLYVRLWSFVNVASNSLAAGWHFIDYVYNAGNGGGGGGCNGTPAAATVSSPASGSVLTGASVVFTWNLGSCVSSVTISVGTSAGASDIFTQVEGLSTTQTVNNLPTNGSTVFVRLTSTFTGGGTANSDTTYTAFSGGGGGGACGNAGVPATMNTPTPSTTLPANPVTFTWTAGCNATRYYLYIGTQPAFSDLYGNDQGTGTSSAPINIPATGPNGQSLTGKTIYVRLWSYLSTPGPDNAIGWHSHDYTYTGH